MTILRTLIILRASRNLLWFLSLYGLFILCICWLIHSGHASDWVRGMFPAFCAMYLYAIILSVKKTRTLLARSRDLKGSLLLLNDGDGLISNYSDWEKFYLLILFKESRLFFKLINSYRNPKYTPYTAAFKAFSSQRLDEIRNSQYQQKLREKHLILNDYITVTKSCLIQVDLLDLYGIPDIAHHHPIIENLLKAQYLHHDDPDIMRALEMIKMESKGFHD